MFFNNKKMIAVLALIIFFVSLDRLLKIIVYDAYVIEPISLVGNLFRFSFAANYNIAMSIPFSGVWVILLNSFIVIVLMYYFLHSIRKNQILKVFSLGMVIAGAVSNIIDRIKFGFVVDYLDLKYFTIFNLADVMIVCGISTLIYMNFKVSKKVS